MRFLPEEQRAWEAPVGKGATNTWNWRIGEERERVFQSKDGDPVTPPGSTEASMLLHDE